MLDLSGAEEMNFDAVPAGRYACTVYEITAGESEATETSKLPDGTPFYNVQFRINDGEVKDGVDYGNRRLFNRYYIPDDEYEKAKILKGMFVSFLKAVGYTEEDIMSGTFEFDPDEVIGNDLLVTVGRVPKQDSAGNQIEGEWNNPVKSVRAPMAEATSGGLL
jgi:hypothetical protein